MTSAIRKAVFPVAGLGTRFLPATKAMAKEMLTVVDRPLIQYAVEEAAAAGIEEFIFVTGRGKAALEDHFDHAFELAATLEARGKQDALDGLAAWQPDAGQVIYTRQQKPLGLGHAVWCARHLIGDEPFAVLLTDELLISDPPPLADLIDLHNDTGGNAISVVEVPKNQTNRYGIISCVNDDGRDAEVTGLVEKPAPADAPSDLAIIGRYVLDGSIFTHLNEHTVGAGGEIQLTDAMAKLIGFGPFHARRYKGQRFDCGAKDGFIQANIALGRQRPELKDQLTAFLAQQLWEELGEDAPAFLATQKPNA